MRIVSLLASATEIVFDLGLGRSLVGISHECDYPPEALDRPRVSRARFDPAGMSSGAIDLAVREAMRNGGEVYQLDADRLRDLAPDLILTQAVCQVCAVPTSLAETAVRSLGASARVVSLDAHSAAGIFDSIVAVGRAAGAEAAAVRRVAALRARMESVRQRVRGRARPRVMAIEWLDPPFVPGHWTPEMIELAGGENLAGENGRPSRQVDWSALSGLDPDVLIVMPCGYGLTQSLADAAAHAARLEAVAPRAIESGRAFVVDGSAYFNRSGPRFVTGIEVLGTLLHPGVFPEAGLDGKAAVWHGRPSDRLTV
jgi:iron complex transport system substrate-binding protein